MKKVYCCYSLNLRNYLSEQGIHYEICALNPNNRAMFWVYIRTPKLNNALNQWTINRE